MSSEEADHIIDVAFDVGFAASDVHLDPVAKNHVKTLRSTEGKQGLLINAVRLCLLNSYIKKHTKTHLLFIFFLRSLQQLSGLFSELGYRPRLRDYKRRGESGIKLPHIILSAPCNQ